MKKPLILLLSLLPSLTLCAQANTMPSLEFTEISFKNSSQDYIKIQLNTPPTSTIQIQDDKLITEITQDQITTQKEIIIYFKAPSDQFENTTETLKIHTTKKGLTATTEQLTITSDEKIIDYACWQNSKIAQSEAKDIAKLQEQIPNLQCLNSEEVKKEGIIKKVNSSWQIINPQKKPKPTKAPKSKTTNTKTPSNTTATISTIKDLEITTNQITTKSKPNYSKSIIMATATIVLSLVVLRISRSKDPP